MSRSRILTLLLVGGALAALASYTLGRGRAPVRAVHGPGGGVERCPSCHLRHALGAPGTRGAHPRVACALVPGREGVGCVACHRGDGLRAAPARAAHRLLLDEGARTREERGRRLEPGCAGCHERSGEPRALAYDERVVPTVAAGLRLYIEEGCPACHRLARVHRATGGGPALDGVGARRSRAELLSRLREPQRESAGSPMPPSSREAHELEALAAFLLAQHAAPAAEASPPPGLGDHFPRESLALGSASAATGALWARRLGCVGCHRLGEADSGVPDLRFVGWYATGEELLLALREPGRRFPGGHMPRVESELPALLTASLLEHLALQRTPLPSEPEEVLRGVCLRCHGGPGVRDAKAVVLARRPPSLSPAPSRERFLDAVTRGRAGSAMAPWGRALSRAFIESLHDALGKGVRR